MMRIMNKFTVIGFYEESGQIFSRHVEALSPCNAISELAAEHPDSVFIAVLNGHIMEGSGIVFAGGSIVDAETVLSQPEVYASVSASDCEVLPEPLRETDNTTALPIARKLALVRAVGDFTSYDDSIHEDRLLDIYLTATSTTGSSMPQELSPWGPFEHFQWPSLVEEIESHAFVLESDIKDILAAIKSAIIEETMKGNLDSDVNQWDMQHLLATGVVLNSQNKAPNI